MRIYLYSFIFLLLPMTVCAQSSNLAEGYDWLATQCKELGCIQDNLDMIDSQIAALVAKRLAFVKRGAELKNTNVLAPKQPGYGNSAERAGEQAKQMGTSKGAVGGVFDAIQKQSNEYEQKYLKSKPKPSATTENTTGQQTQSGAPNEKSTNQQAPSGTSENATAQQPQSSTPSENSTTQQPQSSTPSEQSTEQQAPSSEGTPAE